MKSNVYFSHEQQRAGLSSSGLGSVLGIAFKLASWLTPAMTARVARMVLSKPTAAARRGALPSDFELQVLATEDGDLQIYSKGKGPVVLCVHGWSGNASQFEKLMREIASQGYRAVAFDHYRHGRSGGSDSNYLLFIKATRLVQTFLAEQDCPVEAVVGHSIGGMASLHARVAEPVPHILLSPVVGVFERFRECALSSGIPEGIFERAARNIETDIRMSFAATDEVECLRTINTRVKLMHSEKDRIVSASRSLNLLQTHPALDLDIGAYGGHSSILKRTHTKHQVTRWLHEQLL